jgi:hypothetical protein
MRDTRYHSLLRHYATSRKVAGSSPDEVDFFLIYLILPASPLLRNDEGHAVPQFFEALCYKPEGRGFEFRWGVFFFNWPNPSCRTMALWLTRPLIRMSTRNLPWGVKDGRRVRLTTLPPSVSRLSRENVGASTSHNPMGLDSLLQG